MSKKDAWQAAVTVVFFTVFGFLFYEYSYSVSIQGSNGEFSKFKLKFRSIKAIVDA